MANTTKPLSERDSGQTLQHSYNEMNSTLGVDGFIVGKVGRKIDMSITTTNVANDTENYVFSEGGVNLYTIQIIFTDGTRETLSSVERTA